MNKRTLSRILILAALVLGISALHYGTTVDKDQFHDIYRRLYYIPIVLGGIWFCLRGGIGVALTVSLVYAPHVIFQWGHHHGMPLEQYLEMLLYNAIGLLTGLLSGREQHLTRQYRETARELEVSYDHLKSQADQILEIEEQLRRADRLSALGELAAGMAHEVRNPLASIRGAAEILQDGVAAADPRHEFSRILIQETDRLNRVVQDFLSFASPAPEDRNRLNLNQLVEEVLKLVLFQSEKSGVSVNFTPGVTPVVLGVGEKLKQAFLNLALNAVQAMPRGGMLEVSTEKVQDQGLVRFRDTGCGIPEGELEQIFDPFFTTRRNGTGLGLAITWRIVRSHGGTIEVDSQVGGGSEFRVYLPGREEVNTSEIDSAD
ncbi:MAG TPA: ATP-binding protein [Geothermobacteraceae bacterium]|nr:ATP-binding protein [Geothermobacteraceae bacterium]